MEKQTLTAVQEQEILQANQVAAQLDQADIPHILMAAMSGQNPAELFQNYSQKTQSEPKEDKKQPSALR